MLFDYFSLSEENKQKWKQSIVISFMIGLLYYFGVIQICAFIICEAAQGGQQIGYSKTLEYFCNSICLLISTIIISRIVFSSVL